MAAAMTLLLEHLPKDAPERAEVEAGYRLMMATLLANQREGGLWGQIVDDEGSWDETSGSAMFAYAFQSGCNMNLLGPEYGKAAAKAYAALVAKLDANANIADVCEGTGPKDSREWYLGRGRVNGDPHGQAPLLWLCSAMLDKTLQQPCRTVENIVYRPDLKTENCRLKMKLPEKGNGFATLVWFHGGGLKGGKPNFLSLNDDSIAQVAVKYRFLGETDAEGCIEDAAAAIAWTVKNIAKYGGDPKKVFVAGHSAGGYLALMSALDPKRLAKHGIDNTALAGVIPVSGQVTAHFNVREFSGDRDHRFLPKIDSLSPLSLCANPMPPVFLVVGDRKLDIPCRAEENELMAASLRAIGKKRVCFREFPERNHVSVLGPAKVAMRDYITRTVSEITPPFRTADMLVKAHKLRKAGDAAAALAVENSVKKYALTEPISFDGITTARGNYNVEDTAPVTFAWSCIGQHSNLVNPARFMTFMGAIAGGGSAAEPYIMSRVESGKEVTYEADSHSTGRLMPEKIADSVKAYMRKNTELVYGDWNFPGLKVCAKSGTSQLGGGQKSNAMFAGFVDSEEYPLAFMVVVENGGYGSHTCVPILSKVLGVCKAVMDQE
jgi:acetyl esterase/lipase